MVRENILLDVFGRHDASIMRKLAVCKVKYGENQFSPSEI